VWWYDSVRIGEYAGLRRNQERLDASNPASCAGRIDPHPRNTLYE
jgi:hypothetical protein